MGQTGDKDPAQSGYWSIRESFVSFVLTNMPMLYPLFKNFLEKVSSSISPSNTNGISGRAPSNGQAYRLGSYPESRSKPRNKDLHPFPEDTRFDSDEHIVSDCAEDSRSSSIGRDTSGTDVETGDRKVQSPIQHQGGHSHALAFPGPGPRGHQRSPSNAPITAGIMVTTDFVVSESEARDTVRGDTFLDV